MKSGGGYSLSATPITRSKKLGNIKQSDDNSQEQCSIFQQFPNAMYT